MCAQCWGFQQGQRAAGTGTVAGVRLGSVGQPAGEGLCVMGKTLLKNTKYLLKTRLFTDFGLSLILSFLSVCCRSDHVKRGQHHSPTERFQLELSVTTKVAALLRSA